MHTNARKYDKLLIVVQWDWLYVAVVASSHGQIERFRLYRMSHLISMHRHCRVLIGAKATASNGERKGTYGQRRMEDKYDKWSDYNLSWSNDNGQFKFASPRAVNWASFDW